MTISEGKFGIKSAPGGQPETSAEGDMSDYAIDEAIRRYFMTHDPPVRAYSRVLEEARRPLTPRYDPKTFRSWIAGVSSAAAMLLLVNLTLQLLGVTSVQVANDQGLGGRFLIALSTTDFARWVNESETVFGYSGILFLHTLGLALVVGMSVAIDLRLLGAASRMAVTALRPLFRYVWFGFCVNGLSGAMLFAADAPRKAANPMFEFKLALVMIGVAVMALIERRLLQAESSGSNAGSQAGLRVFAIASLLVWAAAITTGRLVAYTF